MSSHVLQDISVDSIIPAKSARHVDQKSDDFKNLANSIKAGGVKIPIHIWPHPKRKDKYEILAGVRRWRACKSLLLKKIPAVVHRGIDIKVAMILTYIENKFRKDLEPLEEVAEIARCMDHLNSDAKLIADLLGQTEQWVRLRANIHKNLSHGWRQAFLSRDNAFFDKWTIGHLTLVARLPANSQRELLAEIKQFHWQWRNTSVKDLDRKISGALQLLNKAKWNLDDETLLPKAGTCSDCKKRTGTDPVLWLGATSEQVKAKDRCLDLICWKAKMRLYLQQRAKYFSAKFSNLAYRSLDYLSGEEKEELSKTFGRVLDPADVNKSTRGAKDSIPALVVHGKGAGMITFVKEKKFASPGGARRAGKVTPLKERRAQLKCKRWSQVLLLMREKVDAAGVDQVVYKDKITGIMAMAALLGNTACWALAPTTRERNLGASDTALQKRIDDMVKEAKGCDIAAGREKALSLLWKSVKPTLKNHLCYSGPASQTSGTCISSAGWIAKLIRVNIDELFEDVSELKGFTEPKSWKFLNADGTSKTAKKTGKKKTA